MFASIIGHYTTSYIHLLKSLRYAIGSLLVLLAILLGFGNSQAAERDITFLYSDDVKHFVDKQHARPVLIKGGTLIDGTGAPQRINTSILIRDGIIVLNNESLLPTDTINIDATGKWILPGLFDLHAHLTFYLPGGFHAEDDFLSGVRAERFLELYQRIGVTTVSDVASRNNVGFSMKRAQRMGLMGGARLYVSGPGITASGGHPTEFQPYRESHYSVEGDGPWEMRKLVRQAVKKGADFIKIFPPLTDKEYEAIVDEAHAWKVRVTSHAGGITDLSLTSGPRSVKANVDSIHHLSPYGKNQNKLFAKMAKKGIHVVPTIGYHLRELEGTEHIQGNWMKDNLGDNYDSVIAIFTSMQKAGIKFGVGTESNPFNMLNIADIYAQELNGLAHGGLSPMQVIQSATLYSAEVLGLHDRTGSIENGKWADLLIVSQNPLENLSSMVKPELVIQSGNIVYRKLNE